MQPFSLAVAMIEMLYDGGALLESEPAQLGGIGTATFYESNGKPVLVTNWHNVTGVRADNFKPLHSKGLLPNIVRIHYKQWADLAKTVLRSAYVDLPLYKENQPVWLEHPQRSAVDVVVIPLDGASFHDFANRCVNTIDQESGLDVYVGMDCFLLGFPEGLIGPANTPIWKRGSIAREPYQSVPYLVDSVTRKGMSGAPVIAQHSGFFGQSGDRLSGNEIIGTVERFVGIYSGRLGDDALGFQLGVAWRAGVIKEILEAQLPGQHPLEFP